MAGHKDPRSFGDCRAFRVWYQTTPKHVMADMLVQYAIRCHGEEAELMDDAGEHTDPLKVLALLREEREICRKQGVTNEAPPMSRVLTPYTGV